MAKFRIEVTGKVTAECWIDAVNKKDAKEKFKANPGNHQDFQEIDAYDWKIVSVEKEE